MRRPHSLALFLACLLLSPAAPALSILKCVGPDGKIVMSDPPCPAGYSAEVQRVRPNVLESGGLRKWADRNPEDRPAGDGRRRDASSPGVSPAPAAAPAQKPADSVECENARRAYDFESGYRYRTPSGLEMKRRDMEIKCGR